MLYRYKLGVNALNIKQVEICRALSFFPQTLVEITDRVLALFPSSDKKILSSEIENFLNDLEADGMIVSGSSEAELKQKDAGIS